MMHEPPEPPPPVVAKLFRELAHAQAAKRPPVDVLATSFPESRAFVEDEAKLKLAFCTRRSAKSYSFGLHALHTLGKTPNASGIYLALTREEAKRIFWEPVVKDVGRTLNVGLRFNESELMARLPNGSRLYLLGADATEEEKRKILGQKFAIVGIDEAQSFKTDIHPLVYDILKPAVADYRGTICLMGTPGLLAKGLFYELTKGQNPMQPGRWTSKGWSGHRWSAFQNPYMATQWRAEIEELKATHPGIEETPGFRRNYLGEWVVEESALVYRYASGRNDYNSLPDFRRGEWRYVLGCDLGHEDATAWVVCAWHEHDKTLWVVDVQKEKGLDITAVARRTEALSATYNPDVLVVDGANKQAVEEMRNRHKLPWEAADKAGKEDFIELMNGEFIMGRIRLGPSADGLRDEYKSLIWDERKLREQGRRVEHSACDNHAADAALYAWRYCYSYLSEASSEEEEEKPDELELALVARHEEDKRREAGESSAWEETWKWR